MKILWVPVLMAAGLGCTSAPQPPATVKADTLAADNSVPASDTARAIQHIKEVYATINKEKLTQKSLKWETDTTCEAPPMSGTLTYFYRGNEIVKMLNAGGEDHGSWKEEYYFDNGQLVFVYQNNTYGGAANPDEFNYQSRYYFAGGQPVRKTASDNTMQLSDEALHELVKTITRLKKADGNAAIARIFSCDRAE